MMKVMTVADDVLIAIDPIPGSEDGTGEMTSRQRERSAVDGLLRKLLGDASLQHDEAGKPLLEGYHISISHTVRRQGGYVAIMLSKSHEVGIDIEYVSDRIMRIAERFLRKDEKPVTVADHLVCWCAKEAVYKLFSSDDLTYQQMRVDVPMSTVENLKRNITVDITPVVNDNFVLVYTFI